MRLLELQLICTEVSKSVNENNYGISFQCTLHKIKLVRNKIFVSIHRWNSFRTFHFNLKIHIILYICVLGAFVNWLAINWIVEEFSIGWLCFYLAINMSKNDMFALFFKSKIINKLNLRRNVNIAMLILSLKPFNECVSGKIVIYKELKCHF